MTTTIGNKFSFALSLYFTMPIFASIYIVKRFFYYKWLWLGQNKNIYSPTVSQRKPNVVNRGEVTHFWNNEEKTHHFQMHFGFFVWLSCIVCQKYKLRDDKVSRRALPTLFWSRFFFFFEVVNFVFPSYWNSQVPSLLHIARVISRIRTKHWIGLRSILTE